MLKLNGCGEYVILRLWIFFETNRQLISHLLYWSLVT